MSKTNRPSKSRAQAVYPRARSEHKAYFLACLLREQAQQEALDPIAQGFGFYAKPEPYKDAIYTSQARISLEIEKSVKYVVAEGLLPYAHAHTTYFDQQVAQ